MADLSVRLGTLRLSNPFLSASGTFGHGLEMEHFVSPESLGGWVSKTVTIEPRHGNPAPRICVTNRCHVPASWMMLPPHDVTWKAPWNP